jgi:hypothetical protein
MKKVKDHELNPWMRKHRIAGRLFALAFLLTLPIYVPLLILWERRSDVIDAFVQVGRAALLPWEK